MRYSKIPGHDLFVEYLENGILGLQEGRVSVLMTILHRAGWRFWKKRATFIPTKIFHQACVEAGIFLGVWIFGEASCFAEVFACFGKKERRLFRPKYSTRHVWKQESFLAYGSLLKRLVLPQCLPALEKKSDVYSDQNILPGMCGSRNLSWRMDLC